MDVTIRLVVLGIMAVLLGGCPGSPPTDALTAAGDALDRAREAYASDCAEVEFRAAERLLQQAQDANDAGDFERALTLAQAAEEQADLARMTSQANWDNCDAYQRAQSLTDEEDDASQTGEATDAPAEFEGDYEVVPVYFGFDAANLDIGARQTLENHAVFFNEGDYGVVLEGHCDPHGTDEYNLALGERRARTVLQYLVTMGVSEDRLSTISYGEFRTISTTDDRLNRRVEFRMR